MVEKKKVKIQDNKKAIVLIKNSEKKSTLYFLRLGIINKKELK